MSSLRIEGISKRFGTFDALKNIHLTIPSGSLLCLLGPSGCGKTTILRIIAGLEVHDSGSVRLGDTDLLALPPHKRDIGMVFQSHALFPHLDVFGNIAYGLRLGGMKRDLISQRVTELLDLIRLPDASRKSIFKLSGGERQRVAIARALARHPRLFLLDEPTSALDANLRETMQIELRRLQQALGITTIVVTHDQSEAMTISDRIAVMRHGTVEQAGCPMEVYNRPETEFVARFIGTMNILECRWENNCAWFGNVRIETGTENRSINRAASSARVAIRPERVVFKKAHENEGVAIDGEGRNRLRGMISFVRNTGNLIEVHASFGSASIVHAFSPKSEVDADFIIGDGVEAYLPPEHCHLYGGENR
ncbi:MAG: ABC transporter ATP-binding protein [Gammaproteobacteria bacterium]|nr:ABC transporter ATP-binding protein [Gammaproteobacteria bacterium]MCY4227289.1 ABC transporter ATP-binding protein [Gammaproteobacteria bacterium]